ncbi:DUF503 domain-containing protein [Thermodesulfobacteriota bacterium]
MSQEEAQMVVGVAMMELIIHQSSSLKAKRKVVKSILARARNKFDLSIAEVDHHDKWQRSKLGFAVVTNDGGLAHSMLQGIIDYVEGLHLAEVIDSNIEITHY